MSYTAAEVSAATAAMDKYRGGDATEVGAALAVVGLSAERAANEAQIRSDMIRVARLTTFVLSAMVKAPIRTVLVKLRPRLRSGIVERADALGSHHPLPIPSPRGEKTQNAAGWSFDMDFADRHSNAPRSRATLC